MSEYELSYLLLSQSFVIYIDLFIVIGLWLIYSGNRKRHLLLAILAGLADVSRQIPDFFISIFPESVPPYHISLSLQFTASLLFLAALLQLTAKSARYQHLVLAVAVIAFCLSRITMLLWGLPQSDIGWLAQMAPVILVTFTLIWLAAQVSNGWTPSRFLLTGASFTLLVLRIWMSWLEVGEIFYLIIYMEYLVFPMMLAAMILLEAELTNQQVKVLLEQRTQASADLQFIVDNSDDIILISDEVGLVQTWSTQAEKKFGYSAEQAIKKLHMDELFAQLSIGKTQTGTAEFKTRMEAMDGSWFKAKVSTKTVAHRGHVYTIYVLKDVVEAA